LADVRRGLPSKKIIEINKRKIGLMHGQGGAAETLQSVKTEFSARVDVALFGHTHKTFLSRENGTLFFNPGSLHNGREGCNTYGILHLDSEEPWGEIVEL
jgi:hypothetical protein